MKRKEILLLIILFLIAFGLRFYDFTYPSFKWMDETGHIPAATNYWINGQFEPDNWEHPPLRHIMEYGFLRVFGDNPYGWRLRNILFGSAAAVVTYLFARKITGSRNTALLAGLLLATDPLHVVLSRYTFEEVYGGAFFLASIVCYLNHNKRMLWIVLSAFLMGCALATKWYYVPCWLLLYLMTLHENSNYRSIKTVIAITTTYLFVPLIVYTLSFFQWFGRGYSVPELIEFTTNAYYTQQSYQSQSFDYGLFFLNATSAAEWFIRPVMVGQGTYLGAGRGEFILYVNNLPIWVLTFPSMIMMAIVAWKKLSIRAALPVLLFCATYMLFLFIKRPVFIYSATPLLPFAFTAIAFGVTQLANKYGMRLYYAALAFMLMWNLYLYPLVTAKKVPVALYRLILDNANVNTHD